MIIAALCFCLFPAVAGSRMLQDQAGRSVTVPERPQRVIALIPSLTEIVFALGRGDLLVGATQFAKEPLAAAKLPRVGSYLHLDIERIVALRPDLCLAARDGNPEHMIRRIEQLGIPVFALDPRTLQEISDSVTLLGDLLDAREQAAAITVDMAAKMAAVASGVRSAGERPGVFFQIDASPLVSAGPGTFIDGLITEAGGRNLAGERDSYPRFSWEEVLALQPEVVIIASMAGGYSEEQLKAQWFRWPDIPAVKNGRVHVVDASLFDRPVPRLADGLVELARLLHPGVEW
ncbi:MAG TPA: cobalamin-binding protein [Desulfobulbaceae bacterium]|nr:cobalamin-binding protein [Desulfobulbaceae bacterium]